MSAKGNRISQKSACATAALRLLKTPEGAAASRGKAYSVQGVWDDVELRPTPRCWDRYLDFVYTHAETGGASVELHHAYPRALFPEHAQAPWNLVPLTPLNHFKAHWILAEIVPGVNAVHVAFSRMCGKPGYHGGVATSDIPALEKSYCNIKERMQQGLQVRDKEGRVVRLPRNDPRVETGEMKHFNDGKLTVKDVVTGEFLMVRRDDPRIASGELVSQATGNTTVRDEVTGVLVYVSNSDPRFLSGELEHMNKGTTRVVDSDGHGSRVPMDDPRIASGEVTKVNGLAGRVTVVDPLTGDRIMIPKDDPRYTSGVMQHVNKGTLRVVDPLTGASCRVSVTDPRYLSGALVNPNKGKTFKRPDGFVHANKGRVVAFDAAGGRHVVSSTDPKFRSGELLRHAKKPTIRRQPCP